eukprot:TCONS_00016073-protein
MECIILKIIFVGFTILQVGNASNSKEVKVVNSGSVLRDEKSLDFKTRFLNTLTSVESLLKKNQENEKRKKEEEDFLLRKESEQLKTFYGNKILRAQEKLPKLSSKFNRMVPANFEEDKLRIQSHIQEGSPEIQHFSPEMNAKRVVDSGASLYCRYQQVTRYRTYVYHGQVYHYPYYETVKNCEGW